MFADVHRLPLHDGHVVGCLDAYAHATLDLPAQEQALNRLCREAHDGVRRRLRGKPPDQVRTPVRAALKATAFRLLLVTRMNVTTHELIEREALLSTLFAAQVGVLVTEQDEDR